MATPRAIRRPLPTSTPKSGKPTLAKESGIPPPEGAYLFPTVEDGARGVDFVFAALESSRNNAAFVKLSPLTGANRGGIKSRRT